MLQQLRKRLVNPVSLGLDWQAQCLRLVLLQGPPNLHGHQPIHHCLGQWMLPIPHFDHLDSPTEEEACVWSACLEAVSQLVGNRHLRVNLGLPKGYFTWLHSAPIQLSRTRNIYPWHRRLVKAQIKQRLADQRWAADNLNLEASSVLVERLQLAPALHMLLVLNTHYARPVQTLLAHLQGAINTSIEASLEPLVLSRVRCPKDIDLDASMAWWLAQKYWSTS